MSDDARRPGGDEGRLWLPIFIGTKSVKVKDKNVIVVPAQHSHGFEADGGQAYLGPALKDPKGSYVLIPKAARDALIAEARRDKRNRDPEAKLAITHYTTKFRDVVLSTRPMRVTIPETLASRVRKEGGELWICGDDDKLRLMSPAMHAEYEREVDRLVQQIGDDTPWD
jgi:hypothetical protein